MTVTSTGVKINAHAKFALLDMPEKDHQAILDAVDALRGKHPGQWPADVEKIRENPPYFMFRPTPDYRVFVGFDEQGDLKIRDIMGEEQYHWFRSIFQGNGR